MNFAEHVKIRREKFGTVVFETMTEKIFVSDPVGADILELIEQGKDASEILSHLQSNYDGDGEAIRKDVDEFIDLLKSNNLVRS